jgi:hypothetical protein
VSRFAPVGQITFGQRRSCARRHAHGVGPDEQRSNQ